jgi:uncharacterized tellurite resistance protein B-like protein
MAREQALNARKQRNAALVETMLLAAMADGSVSQLEMQTLLRRVIERPEFEGTKPEELNALVETSAQRLAAASNLQEILASLRTRLPDHKTRMLAFGLAAAVAFADQRATRMELGLLKTIQAALGISEDEVAGWGLPEVEESSGHPPLLREIYRALAAGEPLPAIASAPARSFEIVTAVYSSAAHDGAAVTPAELRRDSDRMASLEAPVHERRPGRER